MEPDAILCDVFDDDSVAQLKEVLKVSVGIFALQATELTCLHHRDEASMDLKVAIPNIDSGPNGHVGNIGSGVITESLGHREKYGWCRVIGLSTGEVAEDEVMNAFVDTIFGHVSFDTYLGTIKYRSADEAMVNSLQGSCR